MSSLQCPLPAYWMCHIAVALLIALATWPFFGFEAGLAIGATFYIGREIAQWETSFIIDWKGLAPVPVNLAILLISKLI